MPDENMEGQDQELILWEGFRVTNGKDVMHKNTDDSIVPTTSNEAIRQSRLATSLRIATRTSLIPCRRMSKPDRPTRAQPLRLIDAIGRSSYSPSTGPRPTPRTECSGSATSARRTFSRVFSNVLATDRQNRGRIMAEARQKSGRNTTFPEVSKTM